MCRSHAAALLCGIQHNELEVRRFGERKAALSFGRCVKRVEKALQIICGPKIFLPIQISQLFVFFGFRGGGVDGGGKRFQK